MTRRAPAPRKVLFSDLDGTFLDQTTYQPGPAAGAFTRLRDAGVAVVFCSAKTRAELEALLDSLRSRVPFIVENGAALHMEDGETAVFGVEYEVVRAGLARAAAASAVRVRGYGDMTVDEISSRTGLAREAAARARAREYSETFVIEGPDERRAPELELALADEGLRMVRGAVFWSAQAHHDKGTAARSLLGRMGSTGRRPVSYGIGDYDNDIDMLSVVDVPMLVKRPGGRWADVDLPGLIRLPGIGPMGWCEAAERVLAPP